MIYAIGDSFTAGAELDNPTEAWPYKLSNMLGKEVINQGKQGTGNTRIIKRTVDAVLNSAELIIVGWSDPARLELADEAGIYDVWPARLSNWDAIANQRHRCDLVKYVTLNDIPKYHYANWLRQIILIQNLCKNQNVRCLMFISYYTDHLHKQYESQFKNLVNEIDLKMFVGYTMNESTSAWTYGTKKMPNGHPSPEGHELIANKIYEHIRNIGWVS